MTSLFSAQPVISADRAQIYVHDCSLWGSSRPGKITRWPLPPTSDLAVVFVAQDRKWGTEATPFIAIYILTMYIIAYI